MMALIGHWVKSLIVIVLLGNLAQFILPKGDLKKYAGLIVGLVLLLAMVSPVWSLIHRLENIPASTALLGEGNGNTFQAVVEQEQVGQAEAMVLSYPQVVSCHITLANPHHCDAYVKTGAPISTQTLVRYIQAALAVSTGQNKDQITVHLVVQGPSNTKPATQAKS